MPTAAALVIGNEILSGKTADLNTGTLARALREWGVELRRVLVVPDEPDPIVEGVRCLRGCHDHVFTSGGVGPTHDDVTLAAVARALGRKLVRNAELAALLARHYDVERNPLALRMADVPEGAALLYGEDHRMPVIAIENLFLLPGVPYLFERKLRSLRSRLETAPWRLRQVWVGADEVEIAAALYELAARHPGLALGSYPEREESGWQVKLTLESKDADLVERALAELIARLPEGSVRRTA